MLAVETGAEKAERHSGRQKQWVEKKYLFLGCMSVWKIRHTGLTELFLLIC